MKLLFSFCIILLLATALAQQKANAGPSTTDFLIRRGMILQQFVQKNIFELQQQGKGHLASALEHHLEDITALIKSLYGKSHDETSKQPIENEFTRLEHRIAEDLVAIAYAKAQPHDQSRSKLILQANTLLSKAEAILPQVPISDKDYQMVQNEIQTLNQLIDRTREDTDVYNLANEAEQLSRHELTLKVIAERMSKNVK